MAKVNLGTGQTNENLNVFERIADFPSFRQRHHAHADQRDQQKMAGIEPDRRCKRRASSDQNGRERHADETGALLLVVSALLTIALSFVDPRIAMWGLAVNSSSP